MFTKEKYPARAQLLRDFPWIYGVEQVWWCLEEQVRVRVITTPELEETTPDECEWFLYAERERTNATYDYISDSVLPFQWNKGERLATAAHEACAPMYQIKALVSRIGEKGSAMVIYTVYKPPKHKCLNLMCVQLSQD